MHMANHDVGHFAGHWHQIIGHTAVLHQAGIVVQAFFEQCAADALHDRAAHLLVDQHRIQDPTAVLDRPVLEQLDEAGFDVDFDIRRLHAVGKDERIVALGIVARHHQFGRKTRRQRVRTEVGNAPEFGQRQHCLIGSGVDDGIAVQR